MGTLAGQPDQGLVRSQKRLSWPVWGLHPAVDGSTWPVRTGTQRKEQSNACKMNLHADTAWHSSDDFWALFEEILFSPGRLAAAQAEVDQISALLPIGDGARILDLPCGVGRHALEFARRGHAVVAIDRTASYIER